MLCSGPEGLEHAYLNMTVLLAAIQIYSPSLHRLMNKVISTHHTIDHFCSVKYAELVDLMAENGSSK